MAILVVSGVHFICVLSPNIARPWLVRQPGKVKIFFVEDFVAEPDVALRGRSASELRWWKFWGFGAFWLHKTSFS